MATTTTVNGNLCASARLKIPFIWYFLRQEMGPIPYNCRRKSLQGSLATTTTNIRCPPPPLPPPPSWECGHQNTQKPLATHFTCTGKENDRVLPLRNRPWERRRCNIEHSPKPPQADRQTTTPSLGNVSVRALSELVGRATPPGLTRL